MLNVPVSSGSGHKEISVKCFLDMNYSKMVWNPFLACDSLYSGLDPDKWHMIIISVIQGGK